MLGPGTQVPLELCGEGGPLALRGPCLVLRREFAGQGEEGVWQVMGNFVGPWGNCCRACWGNPSLMGPPVMGAGRAPPIISASRAAFYCEPRLKVGGILDASKPASTQVMLCWMLTPRNQHSCTANNQNQYLCGTAK